MYYIIIILIAANLILASCSSTKTADEHAIPSPFNPDVQVSIKNNTANFIFRMGANVAHSKEKFDFITTITEVKAEIHYPGSLKLDTIVFKNLNLSGVSDGNQKTGTTLYGTAEWNYPPRTVLSNLNVDFLLYTSDKVYVYSTDLNKIFVKNDADVPALELQSSVENMTDASAVFTVVAKRVKAVKNEYIPSSETLRAQIFSEKGTLMWQSGEGMQFLQMIYPVLPKEIGESYKYSIEWNGKKSDGNEMPPGLYKVVLIIPAKPEPYMTTVFMDWNQRYDKH